MLSASVSYCQLYISQTFDQIICIGANVILCWFSISSMAYSDMDGVMKLGMY